MWTNFWRTWLRRVERTKSRAVRPRSRLLSAFEPLECRVMPAVLDALPFGPAPYGSVFLTDGASQVNHVTVNTDGTTATIVDSASPITLSANAVAGGWVLVGSNEAQGPEFNIVTLEIDAGGGVDTVAVQTLDRPITVDTGSGSNTVTVGDPVLGVQGIFAPVQVQSTGGKVNLIADDTGNKSVSAVATLDAGGIRNFTPAFTDITFTAGDLNGLTVNGGGAGNVFYVAATTPGITTNLNSGAGVDFVQVLATTGTLAIQGNGGADTVVLGDSGITDAITGNVSVGNASGQTSLTVDDSATFTGLNVTVVPGRLAQPTPTSTGTITGLAPATITWAQGQFSSISLSSGFGADTWVIAPDASTPITLNAGEPTLGSGDTLILNAVGLTDPVITPSPALPDGQIASSNAATLSWFGIETFPVPLGLGGTFDFAPTRVPSDPNTQPGFLTVIPTDTPSSGPYSSAQVGWVNAGAGGFNRLATYGPSGEPTSPQLARLLRDGEWGYSGSAGVFQLTVAKNQPVEVTVFAGDTYAQRDNFTVSVGNADIGWTPLTLSLNSFSTVGQSYQFVSYSGVFNPGNGANGSTLQVKFDTASGGSSAFWTVEGLDVRPIGLIAPLSVTPIGSSLAADGYSTDTYSGAGAAPNAELTVSPQYGTPSGTDYDPAVKGFQVLADGTGLFSFTILRPTGNGDSLISVTDVTGASGTGQLGQTGSGGAAVSPNPYQLPSQFTQTYSLVPVRRIDFGPSTNPAATTTDALKYIALNTGAYVSTAANALGWLSSTPTPTTFDRGSAYSALQRDGVYGPSSSDFELDMPAASTTYSVTALLGDPAYPENSMYVQAMDPATGTVVQSIGATGVNTLAGQSTSITFPVTSDATGRIRIRFGTTTTNTNPFWSLQSLEVRPVAGTPTPPAGTQASLTLNSTLYAGTASNAPPPLHYTATALSTTVPADGGASPVTYTIHNATAGSLLTVTTSLGTITTADASPGGATYTGIQVQANGSGTATFTINSPSSAVNVDGTISIFDTTGSQVGIFTQTYSGVIPPPPPPPAVVVQRFDFNSGASPTQSTFTGVLNTAVYSASVGYGWKTAVSGYDRGASAAPASSPVSLYQDGAWGTTSGTFEVRVTPGTGRDVRVYVGDPYLVRSGITVSVEGAATAVPVDSMVDWYGFVTVLGGFDSNNDGLLAITISAPTWVASGMDIASPGGLPAPATTAATTLTALKRLEFTPTAIGGFQAVGLAPYTPAAGYGWSSPVKSFSRDPSTFPASPVLTATQKQFYGNGVYGQGSDTFEVAVPLGNPSATYSMRVYISDTYAIWSGITLTAEGAGSMTVSSSKAPNSFLFTGLRDLNGDGVITLNINASTWVMNGIDVMPGTGLPAAP